MNYVIHFSNIHFNVLEVYEKNYYTVELFMVISSICDEVTLQIKLPFNEVFSLLMIDVAE